MPTSVTWDSNAAASPMPAPMPAPAPAPGTDAGMMRTVVDAAIEDARFATLVTAVVAAPDVLETLEQPGPWTVFAPTNEAFAALPEGTVESLLKPENRDQLVAVLTYHVVPGAVYAEDVVELEGATTVEGSSIEIAATMGTVKVDNAQVVATDIEASNGVIHVIDAVILPNS